MMEELSDEQPEMVSHEEAVLAEKEATQNLSASYSTGNSPHVMLPPAPLAAPSPLPAFLSLSPKTTAVKLSSAQATPGTSSSQVAPSSSASNSSTTAPEFPQIPHEGKSKTVEEVSAVSANVNVPSGSPGLGLFGWISSNSLVSKVVEKTKSSMESVITTLDPGMKELIFSGGDVSVIVASSKDNKLVPVREAFQKVFGKATVIGKECPVNTAAQLVGFTAGLKGAEERIANLRQSGSIPEGHAVVAIEGFIVEILPERWFEMSCLLLKDFSHGIELQTFSQPTLIPTEFVLTAQEKTPTDYPLRWAGYSVTIGEVIEAAQPHIGHADWQMVLSGVSRRQSLLLAAQSLCYMYKQKIPTSFVS
ncbi:protein PRRC1-A-like [Physella acuta]|uniref:protein PRRC1-A-like n=1 Tax=Physella acuta TaxID=109671 RepID=UPI0027DDA668|nr:protein PRRC1-A-like [Physella acuta]XP_059176994.1 protein PRRC1-A-like [Physella acuta]XP_059177003.1 protein PRRC1-A-like [Physella acuta]XP_059177012.1 protein PRRC1-A-like [Physella acuta]XP_059177020.1 protein PRRC1-A-like [Physella acuta]